MTRGIIKVLSNKNLGGEEDIAVYPITSTSAVYTNDNNILEEVIKNLQKNLQTVSKNYNLISDNYYNLNLLYLDSFRKFNESIRLLQLTINSMLSYNKNIWSGSIVEVFYDIVNPNDSDIISGSSSVNGTVVWDFSRRTFYNMVIEDELPKYYRWWAGAEKYLGDDAPHSKIYKMNDVLYYYNTELKDLVLLNSKEYLRIDNIIESASVMWYKNWPFGDPDLPELTKVVYIQNPQSSNADSTFSGPVFALVNANDYLIPYEKFDSTVLVKYQDKEGNIIDGLEVSCNGDVYKYNSNTKTLDRV